MHWFTGPRPNVGGHGAADAADAARLNLQKAHSSGKEDRHLEELNLGPVHLGAVSSRALSCDGTAVLTNPKDGGRLSPVESVDQGDDVASADAADADALAVSLAVRACLLIISMLDTRHVQGSHQSTTRQVVCTAAHSGGENQVPVCAHLPDTCS